jgi:hypothetical protein
MLYSPINSDAYDAIEALDFSVFTILEDVGVETWENNLDILDDFTEEEVSSAFALIMIGQFLRLTLTRHGIRLNFLSQMQTTFAVIFRLNLSVQHGIAYLTHKKGKVCKHKAVTYLA